MRQIKIMGLCLVAVFALAAVAVSSASAQEPEWAGCVAQKHGNFTEEKCATVAEKHGAPDHKGHYEVLVGTCMPQKHGNYTEEKCETVATKHGVPDHKGHYEKAPQDKFTAAGGAGVLGVREYTCLSETGEFYNEEEEAWEGINENSREQLPREDCEHNGPGSRRYEEGETDNGYEATDYAHVECENEHATGEATGMSEVANVSVRFKGCQTAGIPVTTPGLGLQVGEIQVNPLKGRLGYINKSAHEVGVLLEPATAGGYFTEFEVEGLATIWRVGVGNPATAGSFYEENNAPVVPAGNDGTGNDGIVSPISPVNTMTRTFTQNYRAEEVPYPCNDPTCGTKNPGEYGADLTIPSHFEGGPLEELEVYYERYTECDNEPKFAGCRKDEWSPGGEEITNVNTLASGYAEIKG